MPGINVMAPTLNLNDLAVYRTSFKPPTYLMFKTDPWVSNMDCE